MVVAGRRLLGAVGRSSSRTGCGGIERHWELLRSKPPSAAPHGRLQSTRQAGSRRRSASALMALRRCCVTARGPGGTIARSGGVLTKQGLWSFGPSGVKQRRTGLPQRKGVGARQAVSPAKCGLELGPCLQSLMVDGRVTEPALRQAAAPGLRDGLDGQALAALGAAMR